MGSPGCTLRSSNSKDSLLSGVRHQKHYVFLTSEPQTVRNPYCLGLRPGSLGILKNLKIFKKIKRLKKWKNSVPKTSPGSLWEPLGAQKIETVSAKMQFCGQSYDFSWDIHVFLSSEWEKVWMSEQKCNIITKTTILAETFIVFWSPEWEKVWMS